MSESNFIQTVLCIGAGYVGGPTMAVMALKCPSVRFLVADINQQRIEAWNSDVLPIYEPGLNEVVAKARGRNLFFVTDVDRAIIESSIIFVSVNTPTKKSGFGAGEAADLQYWEKTARQIAALASESKIVVEKSTLPVRTAEAMATILKANSRHGVHFDVVSNPEFLAEGTAIQDLLNPDRVLIGHEPDARGRAAGQKIADLYLSWVPEAKILRANVWSSELSKLAANAFLAQRVSSINSIARLCQASGADVDEVARAIGMDSRIGSKFLKASVGFGGSCFKKDILNLVYIAKSYGLQEVADYWQKVITLNESQKESFVRLIVQSMFQTLAGKKMTVLGLAFKANTGDVRESPSIDVVRYLLREGAEIWLSDPKALPHAKECFTPEELSQIHLCQDAMKALEGSHALIVCTEWPEYRDLDFQKIYTSMQNPSFVFDGRNILDHPRLRQIGFQVHAIGKS